MKRSPSYKQVYEGVWHLHIVQYRHPIIEDRITARAFELVPALQGTQTEIRFREKKENTLGEPQLSHLQLVQALRLGDRGDALAQVAGVAGAGADGHKVKVKDLPGGECCRGGVQT